MQTPLDLRSRSQLPPNDTQKLKRRKVKTGCRTCKIRKIKCDEGRPACNCCVSTGRICDGYGIWGGGGNRYEQRLTGNDLVHVPESSSKDAVIKLRLEKAPTFCPISGAGLEEQLHFDYFKNRTSFKLPAQFSTGLWDSLVFQACATEPAVLHAVLALSAAHRWKELDGTSRYKSQAPPDKEEEFMLQHYCKAIYHLKPHSMPSGKHSMRITMISCLMFVYLEFLRGNRGMGYKHLESGLKLMESIRQDSRPKQAKLRPPPQSLNQRFHTMDGYLIDAFSRLHVHVGLVFQHSPQAGVSVPRILRCDLPTLRFQCADEARYYLDQMLVGLSYITQELDVQYVSPGLKETLIADQQHIQGVIDEWKRTYDATIASDLTGYEIWSYRLLHSIYTMCAIQIATCLSAGRQDVFDAHTPAFLSILIDSIALRQTLSFPEARERLEKMQIRIPINVLAGVTIPDSGAVAPLYYTLMKCRNHRLRVQAAQLFPGPWEASGVWKANLAQSVVREVIRIEEGGFYNNADEDFDMMRVPSNRDLYEAALLPEERRLHRVHVVFPKTYMDRVELLCGRKVGDEWQILRRVYKSKDCWADGTEEPNLNDGNLHSIDLANVPAFYDAADQVRRGVKSIAEADSRWWVGSQTICMGNVPIRD